MGPRTDSSGGQLLRREDTQFGAHAAAHGVLPLETHRIAEEVGSGGQETMVSENDVGLA